MQEITTFGSNRHLLAEFNRNGMRYLIVGGVAVHFHAPERAYDDLDILIDPSPENADCFFMALQKLGLKAHFPVEKLTQPKMQIPLKAHHYADVVTPVFDIDFAAEWECASPATVNNQPVRIASRDLLRRMKSDSDRVKDIEDIKLLS